ncbi:MAG: 2'-5' RNA ligase family protein [Candidatus Niyogibacteria bacterium]|nr:2'-5' RNA ligase family protein [Candidatus Niyogibacteria bacterium]
MKPSTYTGQLGLVLLLDRSTAEEMILNASGHHIPHVTLYHSKLRGVPQKTVRELLTELAGALPIPLAFTKIAPFGGKFLFWDIERSAALMRAHERALGLSRYFVPTGTQQAEREGIVLSANERRNVQTYGHPLVRELWRPHVTLGYFPHGLSCDTAMKPFNGSAHGIAFVRIGEAGTIAKIISQKNARCN